MMTLVELRDALSRIIEEHGEAQALFTGVQLDGGKTALVNIESVSNPCFRDGGEETWFVTVNPETDAQP